MQLQRECVTGHAQGQHNSGISDSACDTAGNSQAEELTGNDRGPCLTVLVVDDDPTGRRLTAKALKKSGFTVFEAADGRQALNLFNRREPDIVLLDVVMPGMDGFETCRALRRQPSRTADVPIVMVTGADDLDSINRAYDAGATDFITKPLNWPILTQRVRYILRASQAMADLQKNRALLANAQRIAHLGSWELDVGSRRFSCSRETARIFGLEASKPPASYEELLQNVPDDYRHQLESFVAQAMGDAKPFQLNHELALPDGSQRFVSQQVEVVTDEITGRTLQLVGIAQDISVSKRAELFEVDRNRVLEMIIRNRPLPEIIDQVTHLTQRQKPEISCLLFLSKEDRLHLSAAAQVPNRLMEQLATQFIGPRCSCSAAAAYLGQSMVVADIETSPIWETHRQAALDSGFRSSCSIPIFSGLGTVLGTLTMLSANVLHPNREDMKLFDSASKLAAVAIEQRQLAEELVHQARHDTLTGLPNRAFFNEYIQRFAGRHRRNDRAAILFIDLDRFKQVNDSLGHRIGDLLLQRVAERLKECIRETDTLARMGGDEFVIMLDQIESRQIAERIASRVLDLLARPFCINDHELHISASIGVSVFPEDDTDLEVLQKHADIAMYRAKNLGGNRFEFFAFHMKALLLERLEIENEMRKALERGELELQYQPQFDMWGKRLRGVEALLRWSHPRLGRIPPLKFIPVAEESGLIFPIGEWVLQEACRQNAEWQRMGYEPFPVAVNISAVEFRRPDFLEIIDRALSESGLQPRWLQLEITESMLLDNIENAIQQLQKIRSLGVHVAIDDFGTGYSSMSYLQRLPIDCLKIDRSFIKEMVGEESQSVRSRALVNAILGMARELGLKIVAEGIENNFQQELLQTMGCEIGQGFLFKEPITAGEIADLCRKVESALQNGNNGAITASPS